MRYRRRETGLYDEAPYVDEWKPLPPRLHDIRDGDARRSRLGPVAVAPAEVTNAEFAAFLAATGYRPPVANRFLAHWVDGAPAAGTDDEPVTLRRPGRRAGLRGLARCPAADRGRVAGGRRPAPDGAPASRWCGT